MNTKLFGIALLVVFCVFGPQLAMSWGTDGHKIVAQIAQTFMSPVAWSACQKQLGKLNLADIATLPDSYDHDGSGGWSSHLHYANLPDNATFFIINDCVATDGCVVTAIYNYTYVLYKNSADVPFGVCSNNSTASNMSEPCALSFLTHFVGDVHQPMHVAYASDHGGNNFGVTFNGASTNVHGMWDSGMISHYEQTYLHPSNWESFAAELTGVLSAHVDWQHYYANETDPRVWANESFHYTRDNCYNFQPGSAMLGITKNYPASNFPDIPKPNQMPPMPVIDNSHNDKQKERAATTTCSCPALGDAYFNRSIPIIKARLMEGGMRLAALLDAVYAPNDSKYIQGEAHAREVLTDFVSSLKYFEARRPGPAYAPKRSCNGSSR